jgi:hypothetical protein
MSTPNVGPQNDPLMTPLGTNVVFKAQKQIVSLPKDSFLCGPGTTGRRTMPRVK